MSLPSFLRANFTYCISWKSAAAHALAASLPTALISETSSPAAGDRPRAMLSELSADLHVSIPRRRAG